MSLTGSDLLLSTEEALEYLKISRPTLLKYIREGRIKAIRGEKGWQILESDLYRFVKGEENPAGLFKSQIRQPRQLHT